MRFDAAGSSRFPLGSIGLTDLGISMFFQIAIWTIGGACLAFVAVREWRSWVEDEDE
jgi:hypothetical protein